MPRRTADVAPMPGAFPLSGAAPCQGAITPRAHVLKQGNCFAVFDRLGDAQAAAPAAEGLFLDDTRFLSRFVVAMNGERPLLLASQIRDGDAALVVDLANPPPLETGRPQAARGNVHVKKTMFISDDALVVRLDLRNYGITAASLRLECEFETDFVDIFELRGTVRRVHGRRLPDESGRQGPVLVYLGRDGITRRTRLRFDPMPERVAGHQALWQIQLPTNGAQTIHITVSCETGERPAMAATPAAVRAGSPPAPARKAITADITTSSDTFNALIARSCADLEMLVTATPQGPFAYAGLPWFCTPFGRDALLTASQCLWLEPALAAGTLRFLAFHQATATDPTADAEPGKILHEMRRGEMASLGEVPFHRYYGSVDATPLFVMLAAAYYERTGDLALVRELWPSLEAALTWMATSGDPDGDGFLEYHRKAADGLANQGWKDSGDAVFHADGALVDPPVALAEVQAYAYAAYAGAARLADALGKTQRAATLSGAASHLKRHFHAAFWLEDLGSYALALDGGKRPCQVRVSNAGHVLFGGIAEPRRAVHVAKSLMEPDSFSGWGIRTLAEGEARFNPMSYHNGSVWPHDNGIIAMGLGRYGLKRPVLALLTGLADAARFLDMHRLPEFFCGFARQPGIGPVPHPAACAPQAWASASVIAMLGALLGISFDPGQRQIVIAAPMLPASIERIEISNLRLGDGAVRFALQRRGRAVALRDVRRDGDIRITVSA